MRPPVLPVQADVAKAEDCELLVAATVERFGAVDILVNDAALFAVRPLIDVDAAEAARFFAVNAIGPFIAARAFARWAIDHKRGGAIVNVSSIAAGKPAKGVALYSASKAALESLTRSMAVEWAGHGLRVNAVAPGHVATEGVLEDLRSGRLDEKAVLASIPLGRIADGDDIADAVLFLCGDCARHILGHVLTGRRRGGVLRPLFVRRIVATALVLALPRRFLATPGLERADPHRRGERRAYEQDLLVQRPVDRDQYADERRHEGNRQNRGHNVTR